MKSPGALSSKNQISTQESGWSYTCQCGCIWHLPYLNWFPTLPSLCFWVQKISFNFICHSRLTVAQQTYYLCFLIPHATNGRYLSVHGQCRAKMCCLPSVLLDSDPGLSLCLWYLSCPQQTLIAVTICLDLMRAEFGPSDCWGKVSVDLTSWVITGKTVCLLAWMVPDCNTLSPLKGLPQHTNHSRRPENLCSLEHALHWAAEQRCTKPRALYKGKHWLWAHLPSLKWLSQVHWGPLWSQGGGGAHYPGADARGGILRNMHDLCWTQGEHRDTAWGFVLQLAYVPVPIKHQNPWSGPSPINIFGWNLF